MLNYGDEPQLYMTTFQAHSRFSWFVRLFQLFIFIFSPSRIFVYFRRIALSHRSSHLRVQGRSAGSFFQKSITSCLRFPKQETCEIAIA